MNVRQAILSVPGANFGKQLIADTDRMEKMLAAIGAEAGPMKEDVERLILAGGKRLRPMLAWTCWHMTGEKMEILPLMCMLELMHTSSLIHDDFVDQAETRRGVETVSHRAGGLAAHNCGDYLLARAMEFLETYRGTGINEALSVVAQEMCLGELDQRAGLYEVRGLKKETYELRIKRKTAYLMAESCRAGAVAGGADEEEREKIRLFGEHLGMAFQIRDDCLDWLPDADTGKAAMTDLKDGVMTLPAILALKEGDPTLAECLEHRDKSEEELEIIRKQVIAAGALGLAEKELKIQTEMACDALKTVRDCAEKEALKLLCKKIAEVN